MGKFPPKKADKSHIIKAAPKLNWSSYQKAIFKDINQGTGHTIIEARSGSSKTTSIIESFKYIPKGKKTLALAFNKLIQEELRARAPSYIECFTFHSIGLRAIKQRFATIEIDDYKVQNILKNQLPDPSFELIDNLSQTIALCKYSLQDSPKQIESIIYNYGIDLCEHEPKEFISMVIKALSTCKNQTEKIDFNDMCWFPFVYNLPLGQFDYVFVDEMQDLNKSQLVMAKKACKPNGRIIAVGDPLQNIYSFRMSDFSIIEGLKQEENAKVLTLPISYRCPKTVVDLAKNWATDMVCPDDAKEGSIEDISLNELYKKAKPGCFVLSRTNAPLIKICMNFIRNGVKANIRGRDVGKHLEFIIKKSKKKQIKAFLNWLDTWKDDELIKLKEKNIKPDNMLDRYECLVTLCDECSNLEEVEKKIDELFDDSDEKNIIMLSSVHKSKGLEAAEVFLLHWTFRVWLEDDMELIEKPNEEMNISYIASTRTKDKLFLVKK